MGLGNRGDIGFPEAMVATAAVCIIAVAFLSFAASATGNGDTAERSMDWDWIGNVAIEDGAYIISYDSVRRIASEAGADGARLTLDPMGANGIEVLCMESGSLSGDSVGYRAVFNIRSDDGRVVPTLFAAEVFR